MNKAEKLISQLKVVLGMESGEVKLAQMKLDDGVTVLEADMFDAGAEVFIVNEDERIALPIGEYNLEDGMVLVVSVEGVIEEIKAKEEEEEQVEEEVVEEAEAPELNSEPSAPATPPKKVVEITTTEIHFEEMEALKKENEELKAQIELSKVEAIVEEVVELETVKPISHNPENVNRKETIKLAPNRGQSMRDRILSKVNG